MNLALTDKYGSRERRMWLNNMQNMELGVKIRMWNNVTQVVLVAFFCCFDII